MRQILGVSKLIVLSPNSRLAKLIMIQNHAEDHRQDAGDALFRSRKHALIIKGRGLAEKVIKECSWCKILAAQMKKKTANQQMGDLPRERTNVYVKPFTHITLDFVGVFLVKAMNNARSLLKYFPIIFCCTTTNAMSLRVAAGYDTQNHLLQFEGHCAERGRADSVYSDKGTQLVSSADGAETRKNRLGSSV